MKKKLNGSEGGGGLEEGGGLDIAPFQRHADACGGPESGIPENVMAV